MVWGPVAAAQALRCYHSDAMRDRTVGLLAFDADHDTADRLRTAHWVERLRRLGPTESFRVAEDLRRHVKTVRPDWPGPKDRELDLEDHARVIACLAHVVVSDHR
jgi:hypothetical protein